MLFEIALVSILIPTAYWGILYVRRRPFGTATAGWMLIGTAAAAGLAFAGRRAHAGEAADVLGVIALGAGAVQLLIAPVVRSAARWAVTTDRLRLAAVLADIRDVLQPGMGGGDDKRVIAALRDVKEGRVDDAVAALTALRGRAPDTARSAIDERIVLLYLSAQRWRDATSHAERALAPRTPTGPGRGEQIFAALGVSPPVFVELITAHLRLGELDRAAEMAERFEAVAAGVPELTLLVFRLHLVFLAHLGRVEAVDRLIDPRHASYVTPGARRYWAGVARHAAGDVAGARAHYEDARDRAGRDRRARLLVADGLASLDRPMPAPTDHATAVADGFARAPVALPPRAPARRGTVTAVLVALNLAVAAICAFALAGLGDFGSIVRAGANVRGAVDDGEWWRLPSSVFVHVGGIHLVVNLLALWSLGRLVEGLYGPTRTLAIYGVAGLAGAAASHWFASTGVSAGASGAIFGLLGAAVAELAVHRRRYRPEWRRSLLGALIVVTIAQLGIGMAWPMIDQWAHIGGLVAGLALGVLLSPGWRWSERAAPRWIARVVAAALIAAYGVGAVLAATTTYADRLAASPRVTRTTAGLEVEVPARWQVEDGEVRDPDLAIVLALDGISAESLEPDPEVRLTVFEKEEESRAMRSGFTEIQNATRSYVRLPPGWSGRERVLSQRDGLGTVQRYRVVLFAGDPGGTPMVGALYAPDLLAADAGRALGEILATIRPAP